ncbi:uncharacterized protein FA14DRAFT_181634 [Meira miltonrushii]|uniref:Uncharacterized protein n=1 Tax=Meira miltonrushii TaxID=1280837 RepID=A0A316V5V7_9BASI|nr:uncharacterized protein FA14DRAFT_181634 [Meira miltonrushii]PWN32967.1 hypothetical protein FA14DRAFT_181634 [Meira miltonrushii]
MKLVLFVLLSSTLEILLTFCEDIPASQLPFPKRDGGIATVSQKNVHDLSGGTSVATGPAPKKLRAGTRSFENEEHMRKSFSEIGRKGGLATSQAYLKAAGGNPRLAKKLRSNAAKDSMKARQEIHSKEAGMARYQQSNDAYRARFEASALKAKEKGLSP